MDHESSSVSLNELAMSARRLYCNFVDLPQAVDINDARHTKPTFERGFSLALKQYRLGVTILKVRFDIETSFCRHWICTVKQGRY